MAGSPHSYRMLVWQQPRLFASVVLTWTLLAVITAPVVEGAIEGKLEASSSRARKVVLGQRADPAATIPTAAQDQPGGQTASFSAADILGAGNRTAAELVQPVAKSLKVKMHKATPLALAEPSLGNSEDWAAQPAQDAAGVATDSSPLAASAGYRYSATTTRYGHSSATACGGVNTMELVRGTGYIVVASAQSMQGFSHSDSCNWECSTSLGRRVDRCPQSTCGGGQEGCSCKQVGKCWCGNAQFGAAGLSGTASLGCFTCARGRFVRKRPYAHAATDGEFQTSEVKVVVADVCPYGSNAKWCPARPGDANSCGEKNHLDFTDYPPGIDNHFFVFTPEECDPVLKQRMAASVGRCR